MSEKVVSPRPQWNHPSVKAVVANEFSPAIFQWAINSGVFEEETDIDDREFRALVTLSMIESPDAYSCGRYLEDHHGWPTDGELIRILDRAFMALTFRVKDMVHDWVLKNRVRFPARVGDRIDFKMNGHQQQGLVTEMISREARAIVDVSGAADGSRLISVNSEQVFHTYRTSAHRIPKLKMVDK